MPSKVAKVHSPKEMKPLLEYLIAKLGLTENEIFRMAFIEYASKQGLFTERLKIPFHIF